MKMDNTNLILWPGWETRRVIGRGSFGTVYEISRQVFGKEETAALKMISIPETADEVEELENEGYDAASISTHYKQYLEEIVREYSMMLDLKGCSNVVYCDDLRYEAHGDGIGWDIFIKMELLTPLRKAISPEYNEAEVIKLGMDLCSALKLCRTKNIIHRDIKPENIFVSQTGDFKLGDFGVAKVSDKTGTGTKIGTFDYMAPEVYLSKPYGFSADIYSLGIVMYWMMNNRLPPFLTAGPTIPSAAEKEAARSRRFSGEALPAPSNGSPALWAIVKKACNFQQAGRYLTPDAMYQDLQALIVGSAPAPVVPPITPEPTPEPKKPEPKPEPKKPEPKPEPKKPEPKPEPKKPEPRPEPKKPEPKKPAPNGPVGGTATNPACIFYISTASARAGKEVSVISRVTGNRLRAKIPANVVNEQVLLLTGAGVTTDETRQFYAKICIRDTPMTDKPRVPITEVPDEYLIHYANKPSQLWLYILLAVLLGALAIPLLLLFTVLGILAGSGAAVLVIVGVEKKNLSRNAAELLKKREQITV